MSRIYLTLVLIWVGFPVVFAQEPPKQKEPHEVAAEEAVRMEKELELTPDQVFYVDSVLQYNYAGLKEEFDSMSGSGMQDARNYETVRDKWIQKNLDAFKKILPDQQYIKYLKMIGKGKEYKKGKDGLYYKKEIRKKGTQ